jgi:hypothetical protein
MHGDDANRFTVVMTTLGEVFDTAVSTVKIRAYWEALDQFVIDAIEGGAKIWMREGRKMPSPADLLECAQRWARDRDLAERTKFADERGLPRDAGHGVEEATPESIKAQIDVLAKKMGWR